MPISDSRCSIPLSPFSSCCGLYRCRHILPTYCIAFDFSIPNTRLASNSQRRTTFGPKMRQRQGFVGIRYFWKRYAFIMHLLLSTSIKEEATLFVVPDGGWSSFFSKQSTFADQLKTASVGDCWWSEKNAVVFWTCMAAQSEG